ncbi:alpha/beta-hydrolase [Penicillium capsulatum]|uniref:Alpha/beta-hydrolase n=1 Tax=Penicillium capsulatum TaxID=69766 RepID=A0A9W9LYN7_9EURO|nr:alpha/beta-hydrolase [Penicillium capsulatum]KAJ6130842.1 alpha/beta-hydrolase [Penicillium capsulatum]
MIEHKLLWLVPGLILPNLAATTSCSDISLEIDASSHANDIVLPNLDPTTPNFLNGIVNSVIGDVGRVWPLIPVTSTFNISATLCEPKVYNHANAIQLLSHGASFNKLYWSGLGLPEDQGKPYDWTHFATDKGYATLAIDRPGVGNSSHPDPLLEVQASLEAEVLHQIVLQLRQGKIKDKKFSKVLFVGHSLGSLIGVRQTQLHPQDYDAVVLTGWSAYFLENLPNIFKTVPLPASVVIPQRFADLNPLYLTLSLQKLTQVAFFGPDGSFDPAIEQYNWDHRDVVATGELISIFSGITSTTYAGPVHVIDGDVDQAFCNGKCTSEPDSPPGSAVSVFPKAKKYTYDIIPNTGHCLNIHYSASKTFMSAHKFLHDNFEKNSN